MSSVVPFLVTGAYALLGIVIAWGAEKMFPSNQIFTGTLLFVRRLTASFLISSIIGLFSLLALSIILGNEKVIAENSARWFFAIILGPVLLSLYRWVHSLLEKIQ